MLLFSILPVRITSIHIPTSLNNFGLDREWLFIFNYSNILVALTSFKNINKKFVFLPLHLPSCQFITSAHVVFYCYFTPSISPPKNSQFRPIHFQSVQANSRLQTNYIKIFIPAVSLLGELCPSPSIYIHAAPFSTTFMCLLGANDGAQIFLI